MCWRVGPTPVCVWSGAHSSEPDHTATNHGDTFEIRNITTDRCTPFNRMLDRCTCSGGVWVAYREPECRMYHTMNMEQFGWVQFVTPSHGVLNVNSSPASGYYVVHKRAPAMSTTCLVPKLTAMPHMQENNIVKKAKVVKEIIMRTQIGTTTKRRRCRTIAPHPLNRNSAMVSIQTCHQSLCVSFQDDGYDPSRARQGVAIVYKDPRKLEWCKEKNRELTAGSSLHPPFYEDEVTSWSGCDESCRWSEMRREGGWVCGWKQFGA